MLLWLRRLHPGRLPDPQDPLIHNPSYQTPKGVFF